MSINIANKNFSSLLCTNFIYFATIPNENIKFKSYLSSVVISSTCIIFLLISFAILCKLVFHLKIAIHGINKQTEFLSKSTEKDFIATQKFYSILQFSLQAMAYRLNWLIGNKATLPLKIYFQCDILKIYFPCNYTIASYSSSSCNRGIIINNLIFPSQIFIKI